MFFDMGNPQFSNEIITFPEYVFASNPSQGPTATGPTSSTVQVIGGGNSTTTSITGSSQ